MYSPIEGNVAVGNIALIGRWSYRSAQVMSRHAVANNASLDRVSRDARWWAELVWRSEMLDRLNAVEAGKFGRPGSSNNNHVVYCFRTLSGRTLYVQRSDGHFYFGWSVRIGVW